MSDVLLHIMSYIHHVTMYFTHRYFTTIRIYIQISNRKIRNRGSSDQKTKKEIRMFLKFLIIIVY